ncbi:MAG: class I SAM-dependent methyltransferase [Planctomycetes bacterium]|nr:class I SAM-dependent methyltransferase [Planctomycetota bacterium]
MSITGSIPIPAGVTAGATFWQRQARAAVLARLRRLRSGGVLFDEGAERTPVGAADGPFGQVVVRVRSAAFWTAVMRRGALGAGEAWQDELWTSADPARLVRLFVRDQDVLSGVDRGLAALAQPLQRLWQACRRNTRAGARRNIAAHYDLGDDFFAAFLDPSMTYSSAFFATAMTSLADAQRAKLERLLAAVDAGEADRLLEIGTGWGSMALAAAGRGCRVTTTTISARQFAAARARVAAAGRDDRVVVLQQDYRDLVGTWDKIVSVEMIEAIGARQLPTFFATCAARLRPGGCLGLQAITIRDQDYASALRRVDFIKRHVFPGSFIPSVTAMVSAATAASDLRLWHAEDLAPHYAETLRRWRQQFLAQREALLARGYDARLLRTFDWYLAYCEGGFAERKLGVQQMVFVRPGCALPPVRHDDRGVVADPYRPTAMPAVPAAP